MDDFLEFAEDGHSFFIETRLCCVRGVQGK